MRVRNLAARIGARVDARITLPNTRRRRECRVKASPMARLLTKCRRQVPQVKPNTPAFPARRS